MRYRTCLVLPLFMTLASAQETALRPRSAWVLAIDAKGNIAKDLKAEEFKVVSGGRTYPVKRLQSPAQTSSLAQNWVIIFEPILDPAFRSSACKATAQLMTGLLEGDRVLIVARTRQGLVPLTPGLTVDRLAWVKALEKLPGALCTAFEGTPGKMDPSLLNLADSQQAGQPGKKDAFQAALKGFLDALPKAIMEGPYNQRSSRGVRPIDKLGFDSPSTVRGRLNVVGAEMKSMEQIIGALGKLSAQSHCLVFSRSDADDFNHPSVIGSMNQKKFERYKGDEGGPAESAELAVREMTLNQESFLKAVRKAGVTLYSVAGTGTAFLGNLGNVAGRSGGYAFFFEPNMPQRVGSVLLSFGSRYSLEWEETEKDVLGAGDSFSITTSRKDVKLFAPSCR